MRLKLLQAIRDYFPDTRIYMVGDKILLVRGHMYTAFLPDPSLWEQPFTSAIAQDICEQLAGLHNYEVDTTFMEPEETTDEGSVPL